MAQTSSGRVSVEKEDVQAIRQNAIGAAEAFRAYIKSGDEAQRGLFWSIYNTDYKGKPFNQLKTFTDAFYKAMESVRDDPVVAAVYAAFKKDRNKPIPGILTDPAVLTDFIDAVWNVRSALTGGVPADSKVQTLVALVKATASKGIPVKPGEVYDVRQLVKRGVELPEAARLVLMQSAITDAAARFGKALTDNLLRNMPQMQAGLAVDALKEYILTGEQSQLNRFQGIWYANDYNETFKKAFTQAFVAQIYDEKDAEGNQTGLSTIAHAYNLAVGIDPGEFGGFIKDMYNLASSGTREDVDRMTERFVAAIGNGLTLPVDEATNRMKNDVVGPLLVLVARGKARQAIGYMHQVAQTGDQAASAEFARVYDGKFLGNRIEDNDDFFKEFGRLYNAEIRGSGGLQDIVANFERNNLPIAIRDIYTELLKQQPDMERLEARYGQDFVALISSELPNLGWLIRENADLGTRIERRASMGDSTASGIRKFKLDGKAAALAETYLMLAEERIATRSIIEYTTINENFDQLSWLSGTPDRVQKELNRKVRANDPQAIALASAHPPNSGAVLSEAYAAVMQLRNQKSQLETRHGKGFVDFVAANLDSLSWVVKPVAGIESGLKARRSDAVVAKLHQTAGYGYETLALSLKDIYAELNKATPDRTRLASAYGNELVSGVEQNRASLGWLSGDARKIESGLRTKKDAVAAQLKQSLYSYSPVHFVASLSTARTAAMRPGLAREDAQDTLGYSFLEPAAAKEAGIQEPLIMDVEDRRTAIESRWQLIRSEILGIDRQLNYKVLKPVRALLGNHLARWAVDNERIRTDSKGADSAELDRLDKEQADLLNVVITSQELRKAVEMAFAMTHLAETGGDLAGGSGFTGAGVDTGTMAKLMTWYRSLEGTGKQAVIGDVVAGVLSAANPQIYGFIGTMNERGFFRALTATYAMTQGRSGSDRAGLVNLFGAEFVALAEQHAASLRMLESPTTSQMDMAMGENALFAGILIRCYQAIAKPQANENREAMVGLFGEQFVAAVEKNKDALASLAAPGIGLEEVKLLPKTVLDGLMAEYPSAYKKSIGALTRAYRKQDDSLFEAISTIYGVLNTPPRDGAPKGTREEYTRKLQNLKDGYGNAMVDAVRKNMNALKFLERPMAGVGDMHELAPNLLASLHDSFERGPGVGRANFMANFDHAATMIPQVYLQLKNALLFASPTDRLGKNFTDAVTIYRQEFGYNDYLFNQYVNMGLLNKNLQTLGQRRGVQVPEAIKTPEALGVFLSSEAGRSLVSAGRTTYEKIKTEYLMQRQSQNFNPETGEFTNEAVQLLSTELSVMDALYMGVALEKISGTNSAFGPTAASELMNTLLVLSHRDPYLVGPYLLQVLPALIEASQDEETLMKGMMAFRTIFETRHAEGLMNLAYSTALTRQYFLKVFENIGKTLPEIVSMFDHNSIEDELRQTPESRTDEGFLNPMYYRYKPGWWQYQGDTIPMLYGQPGEPLNLLPQPLMPQAPYNPIPGRGLVLDSDAMGLFSRMYDQLRPPTEMMFGGGVPARFRIGALGASTIIRRINELFGPMPVDYQDYWLGAAVETGMFYSSEGVEDTAGATTNTTTSQAGGGGAAGVVRGITGGADILATAEGKTTTTTSTGNTDQQTDTDQAGPPPLSSKSVNVDVKGAAAGVPGQPVPLPLVGLYPDDVFNRGNEVGIHNAQQEFHYESTKASMAVPGTENDVQNDVKTTERVKGLLSTYQRIAKENKTDMLFFVAGDYVPELKGPVPEGQEGPDREVMQEKYGNLKSRLYFITQEGNIYNLAYGRNTEAQMLNYLFANTNRQESLASVKFIGKDLLTGDAAAGGFDGAAVGFTLPTASGDTFSSLAFGELVRNIETMSPVHAEQALGMAVTNMLDSRAQRDIYAAFYRGAETVQTKPDHPMQIDDKTEHAQTSVDVMWRRMRIDPLEKSWELRAVGGYPLTVGAMGKLEKPENIYHMRGYGATAAWSEMDLLREFRTVDTEAEGIYSKAKSMLVQLYGWSEDKAANTGWLIAADYMYGRLEDRIGTQTTTDAQQKDLTNNYATLLMMYWADRHGVLVGGQRVPGYTDMTGRINRAMLSIQQDPQNEENILKNLAEQLKEDFQSSIWRFSLGYGYDGEKIRLYTVASAQLDDNKTRGEGTGGDGSGTTTMMPEDMSYGNLYSLFMFGRPTVAYADLLSHFYGQAPLVIGREENGTPVVKYDPATPYVDLYSGFGLLDWPALDLMRYERRFSISDATDVSAALRDAYREVGSATASDQRILHLYGGAVRDAVEQGKDRLDWMIRPAEDIARELQARMKAEDPIVRAILARTYGGRLEQLTSGDYREAGKMMVEIYKELRTTNPETERLWQDYGKEVVDIVASRAMDLDWVLLPQDRLKREFGTRAAKDGTVENIVADNISIAAHPTGTEMTGTELQRLCETNLTEVLLGATNAESAAALGADKYDIIRGSHLRDNEETAIKEGRKPEKGDTFYILVSPAAASPGSKGSVVIGNGDDLSEWRKNGYYIGKGVSRLEIKPDVKGGGDYEFVFSGDRRLTALSAEKLIGGITLPLKQEEYERYRAKDNWTIGGIVELLQDHQNDWLLGALYGLRGYGDQRWQQFTITSSLRHQLTNTATYSDQIYWYTFFNQVTKKIVIASSDVWENEDELRQVCSQLGGCNISDLRRITGGAGLTWARTDIITGEKLSLHFFFEGGTEQTRQYRSFEEAGTNAVATDLSGKWSGTEFIFRGGAAVSFDRQTPGSLLGEKYTLGITGAKGNWPVVPGQVTRPEYFAPYMNNLMASPMGWWVMLYGQINW